MKVSVMKCKGIVVSIVGLLGFLLSMNSYSAISDHLQDRMREVFRTVAGGAAIRVVITPEVTAQLPDHVNDRWRQAFTSCEGGTCLRITNSNIVNPFYFDDFLAGDVTTGNVGMLGWRTSGVGSFFVGTDAEPNRPGTFFLSTSSTSDSIASIFLPPGGHSCSWLFDFTFAVKPLQSDSNVRLRIGTLGPGFTNPSANGVYFEKLGEDTNWFGVTRAANVQTRTDTGVAVTGGTWYKLRVRRISATQMGLSINDGPEIVHTTNLPTIADCFVGFIIENPGAAVNKDLEIDYAVILFSGLVR